MPQPQSIGIGERAVDDIDQVDDDPDTKKTRGEQVENAHAGFTDVEHVTANSAQENAQQQSGGFIFGAQISHSRERQAAVGAVGSGE